MQDRFKIFRRGAMFYCEDRSTGQQKSLQTRDASEARRILQARNDAVKLPQMNLAMAKAYLSAQDPKLAVRTWADVMLRFCDRQNPNTRRRHERVTRTAPMLFLKSKRLLETTAEDLLAAMKLGKNSAIQFLQTMHNDALGMGWILAPILARKLWPKMKKKPKRAITETEHITLLSGVDDEWRLYLQLLWFVAPAQTDAANLTDANVDWQNRVLRYDRQKLNGRSLPPACLAIGKGLEEILSQLPRTGPLFPNINKMDDRSRACFMWKLCKRVGIKGVSLHSYRYSLAERAKIAGIPQRWAQAALGHNSKAVHDAYARNALVICPPIDEQNRWSS
jgi:integrase